MVLPRQPHLLRWRETNLERVRAEDRQTCTQAHNLAYTPHPKINKKKKPHHGWIALILMSSISKLPITLPVKMPILHCSFSPLLFQLLVMCCKEQTNMILHWGMYFYKLLYNWGLCSEATIGLQLKYFVRLQQFCESSRELDWWHWGWGGARMCATLKKHVSGKECLLDNRRRFPICLHLSGVSAVVQIQNPHLHLLALTPAAHQTRPIRA